MKRIISKICKKFSTEYKLRKLEKVKISFPEMSINRREMEKSFDKKPIVKFVARYGENGWIIKYDQINELFVRPTLNETVSELINFLNENPVIHNLGTPKIKIEEE